MAVRVDKHRQMRIKFAKRKWKSYMRISKLWNIIKKHNPSESRNRFEYEQKVNERAAR